MTDMVLMIVKNALLTALVIPFVLIGQVVLWKEEKRLGWKGVLAAFVIVNVLLFVKTRFGL
jgi:hypothetical protein